MLNFMVNAEGGLTTAGYAICIVLGVLLNVGGIIMFCGLKVIHPNEAFVLTL